MCVVVRRFGATVYLFLAFFGLCGHSVQRAHAQNQVSSTSTLGEMVNSAIGGEAAQAVMQDALGGDALGSAVTSALTDAQMAVINEVFDHLTANSDVLAEVSKISRLTGLDMDQIGTMADQVLGGDLLGGTVSEALSDLLGNSVGMGIDALLGGKTSAELQNIVSGLLGGLGNAATNPAALLDTLRNLGLPMSALGLTEDHMNALLGLALPVCPAGAAMVCTTATWDPATAVTVGSAAELARAINGLGAAGGTILLGPGSYGSLSGLLSNLNPAENITIASADPTNPAMITQTSIRNSSNITLANLKFFADGTGNTPYTHSVNDTDARDGGTGVIIDASRNITISGSLFSGHTRGVFTRRSSGVSITGNSFRNTNMDHMAFTEVDSVLIEGNYTEKFAVQNDVGHNDSIQFWHTQGTPSSNITIRNNVLTSNTSTAGAVQHIFLYNEVVTRQGGTTADYYKNILIEGNTVVGSHPHGITVGHADGVTVRDNTVRTECGMTNPGWQPRINVEASNTNVSITGNTANAVRAANTTVDSSAMATPAGWDMSGNTLDSSCVPSPVLTQAPGCADAGASGNTAAAMGADQAADGG